MSTTVLTRDQSSGRIHKRIQIEDSEQLLTYEGCNLDAAGAYELLDQAAVDEAEPDTLCERCFPPSSE